MEPFGSNQRRDRAGRPHSDSSLRAGSYGGVPKGRMVLAQDDADGKVWAMNDSKLRTLLEGATTIAVVGASTDPDKTAHHIPALLIRAGYTVIPVHPSAAEVLGQPAFRTLADIPVPIDIVDVFRPSGEAAGIAEQAVEVGAKALWLQLGISSSKARRIAKRAGMTFVEDLCIGATSERLGTHPPE